MFFMPWVRSGKDPRHTRRAVATSANALYTNDENGLQQFSGSCRLLREPPYPLVMLSEAKHLLLFEELGDKQILR